MFIIVQIYLKSSKRIDMNWVRMITNESIAFNILKFVTNYQSLNYPKIAIDVENGKTSKIVELFVAIYRIVNVLR